MVEKSIYTRRLPKRDAPRVNVGYQYIIKSPLRKSLYPPSSGLYALDEGDDVFFLVHAQLVPDVGFALVNGADALLGDHADLFRGESGAKQTT